MKKRFILLFFLFFSFTTYCQLIRFKGRVINKSTKQTLEGASINLSSLKAVKYTNDSGEFMFPKFKAGKALKDAVN